MDTGFLFCGKRFLLFNLFFLEVETVTKISGNPFFRKEFSTQWKLFLLFCASFLQVETVTETS